MLNTTSRGPLPEVRPEALAFHRDHVVVDLLLGSALFRRRFVSGVGGGGHADVPRLMAGGVDLIGLSIATRFPDLQGRLSTSHFRALGFPMRRLGSDMALVEAIVARIRRWEAASGGRLRLVASGAQLDGIALDPGRGRVGAFLGIQGGHALDGDAGNVEVLRALGVRMLAPAHVMDNALVGSNTGVRRGGLTQHGRDVVAECERLGVVVDLAHMSSAGIRDTLPLLTRPFVLSHTGFTELSGRSSRWRRFSPA
jgi:microsomal dipeptidase-like Zn-dependent dipeptidase